VRASRAAHSRHPAAERCDCAETECKWLADAAASPILRGWTQEKALSVEAAEGVETRRAAEQQRQNRQTTKEGRHEHSNNGLLRRGKCRCMNCAPPDRSAQQALGSRAAKRGGGWARIPPVADTR
jgi:hypothetical protein